MTAGRTAESPVIRIHPADDVVIARRQLVGGTKIVSEGIVVAGLVPPGHKVVVRAIPAGAPVRRYNQIIGTATQPIAPGQHVHTHNRQHRQRGGEHHGSDDCHRHGRRPARANADLQHR